ncbi:MAG: hypothetical protein ACRDT2_20960 [Natronosporangium sp.]
MAAATDAWPDHPVDWPDQPPESDPDDDSASEPEPPPPDGYEPI